MYRGGGDRPASQGAGHFYFARHQAMRRLPAIHGAGAWNPEMNAAPCP